MLIPAPLESARFGLRVFRGEPHSIDADALLAALVRECVDVAILRVPTGIASKFGSLSRLGLQCIHADTLVRHECLLQEVEPKPLRNAPDLIQLARHDDALGIAELVKAVFKEYPNHYHANPLFDRGKALDGYCEWALSHLAGAGRITWLVRVHDRIAAVACSAFDERGGTCHGVLHGVHPDFSGHGYYTDLIRHTQHHFRRLGYQTLNIATQVGNLPVQRVWGREDFHLAEALDTFHINALLDLEKPSSRHAVLIIPEDGSGALSHFLDAANALANSSTPGLQCNLSGAMWAAPNAGDHCKLNLRNYVCSNGPIHTISSISLRDSRGRIRGIARSTTTEAWS